LVLQTDILNTSENKCCWERLYFKWSQFITNAEAYSSAQHPFISSCSEKKIKISEICIRRRHSICCGSYATGKLEKHEKALEKRNPLPLNKTCGMKSYWDLAM